MHANVCDIYTVRADGQLNIPFQSLHEQGINVLRVRTTNKLGYRLRMAGSVRKAAAAAAHEQKDRT
jgi:hypothetical protein